MRACSGNCIFRVIGFWYTESKGSKSSSHAPARMMASRKDGLVAIIVPLQRSILPAV
ncbi:MAG: hypothetical protein ABF489_03405 [Bifidobacterium sp.]